MEAGYELDQEACLTTVLPVPHPHRSPRDQTHLSNFSISEDTAAELGLASTLGARPLATRGSAGSGRDGGGGMGSGGGGSRGICR